MVKLLRALRRALSMMVLMLAAMLGALAIKVRWPSRREDAVVQVLRAEDAPRSPTPHLEVRR